MELALNLVCFLIGCGSLLAWIVWRRQSSSVLVLDLFRGFFVIALVLMLFLPAVSITDDLAQAPALAEGVKLQDVFKAPEQVVLPIVALILSLSLAMLGRSVLWREANRIRCSLITLFWWNSNIQKRPPPQPAV